MIKPVIFSILNNPNWTDYLDFALSTILVIFFNLFVLYIIKRRFVNISNGILSVLFIIGSLLDLPSLRIIAAISIGIITIISMFTNLAEIRSLLANKSSQKINDKGLNKKNNVPDNLYSHEDFYNTIDEATRYLSKHKIGAIMTFERKDNLLEISKNGTLLDAPVTYELLVTIFYPGTRLHDGAVVIRGNKILAASVYYTPTTKPLIGKFGSRHRAAIGISEICDAVTVVVSEETGKISIAYNGEIESYTPDDFRKAFANIMAQTDVLSVDSTIGGMSVEE